MEKYNNEKYKHLENVEALFQRINHFGNEYNYCFGTFIPMSVLPLALGAVGGLIEAKRQKNHIHGYIVNKNENEICLIPLLLDHHNDMLIDIDGHIVIQSKDMKSIKIKNEDLIYKRITITCNDNTKYVMKTAKNMKGFDYHKNNLNKFIEIYQSL